MVAHHYLELLLLQLLRLQLVLHHLRHRLHLHLLHHLRHHLALLLRITGAAVINLQLSHGRVITQALLMHNRQQMIYAMVRVLACVSALKLHI